MVGLVFLVFFVLSFLTNILGPIIPDIIDSFHVSLGTAAAFLPFSFFLAYGVFSDSGGFSGGSLQEKPVMVASFVAALGGALSFAIHPTYAVALVSLFSIGAGMAMLQVAINPLLRVAGGEEHFAFNEAIGTVCFWGGVVCEPDDLCLHGEPRFAASGGPVLRMFARVTPTEMRLGLDLLDLCRGFGGGCGGADRRFGFRISTKRG